MFKSRNSINSPVSADFEPSAKVSLTDLTMTKIDEAVSDLATVTKEITGEVGGTISLSQNILSSQGQAVQVTADFEIPANAFAGTQNFTMKVDVDSGSISFFPHITFNKSCKLNFRLTKMELANIGIKPYDLTAKFVYFDESGSIQNIPNMGVQVFYYLGYIAVYNAKIDHFSRYGFIRKEI